MTYWYTARCLKCGGKESPPLFVTFHGKISLYPLDDAARKAACDWIEEHAFHGIRLLHEDDEENRDPPDVDESLPTVPQLSDVFPCWKPGEGA